MTQRSRTRRRFACLLALLLPLQALAYNQDRVATDEAGNPVRIAGSVVLVEPDIELTEVTAGGLQEPRREWSDTARRLFPEAMGQVLSAGGKDRKPDFEVRDDLPPRSRLGQVIRLNEAVAMSIAVYTRRGSHLATKGRRLDWTLGPGVQELREATGADYALFTYVRDSYASEGRTAMRVLGFLAGAAMASQPTSSKASPSRPASGRVGRWGMEGRRLVPCTPIALSRPASTCCLMLKALAQVMSIWPPSRSCTQGA